MGGRVEYRGGRRDHFACVCGKWGHEIKVSFSEEGYPSWGPGGRKGRRETE